MSVFGAALISFFAVVLICWHLSPRAMRRLVGYPLIIDVLMHGTVIYVFYGTSTLGLLQAELSAIFISLSIRGYRSLYGWERMHGTRWVRYAGRLTKAGSP